MLQGTEIRARGLDGQGRDVGRRRFFCWVFIMLQRGEVRGGNINGQRRDRGRSSSPPERIPYDPPVRHRP